MTRASRYLYWNTDDYDLRLRILAIPPCGCLKRGFSSSALTQEFSVDYMRPKSSVPRVQCVYEHQNVAR